MTIIVKGLDEVQTYLGGLRQRARGNWKALIRLGIALVRYAGSISPVVTGSYAGSHRAVVDGKTIEVSINPSARNTETNVLVTRYASAVEARHRIYGRVGEEAMRLGVTEEIADEVVG